MENILNMHQHKEIQNKEEIIESEIINELQPYMFYNIEKKENIVKAFEVKEFINKINTEKIINSDFFYPEQKDQLFWCYYIFKNGFGAYEYPGTTSYSNEKKVKFECIELLRIHKQILKENKIKNIKEDVENELAQKSTISRKTFIALCSIEKQNILYIENHKYYDILVDPNSLSYHVVHCIKGKYCYETDINQIKIDKYKSSLFKCDNFEKPLKAISYYKLGELIDICKYLNFITDFNKKTKKDLYELLLEKL